MSIDSLNKIRSSNHEDIAYKLAINTHVKEYSLYLNTS